MNHNKYLNAMRSIALQSILNAGQGHTGMAISAIPLVYTLYTQNININVDDGKWINRDRFVLSAGHGSMSLYSLFYLSKLIDINDIKNYRQENSKTPGHPEFEKHKDNYVDCSTGPLGQGVANAVGMAIAEVYLSKKWNKLKGLIDHYTYVIVGDGDLQEGICYESMSLAGKLKLNKLIMLHDSNDYQLDSSVITVNNENLKKRVEAQNWIYLKTTNDIDSINECIQKAKRNNKPTFIEVKTIIGEGTSAQNSFKAHGLKVTKQEIELANKHFNMNYDDFKIDNEIFNHFKTSVIDRGLEKYKQWNKLLEQYKKQYPKLVDEFLNSFDDNFNNKKINDILSEFKKEIKVVPTKNYLKEFFDLTNKNKINHIITLSADLASTTFCKNNEKPFNDDKKSPYIMAGIREFAMSGIQNGVLLHKGLKSFAGTFLSFADYMKSTIRVGALSFLPSLYIFTHDSYLVGGDGPTHQPYDQLAMLRAIDNVYDIRPCNRNEFAAGMKIALDSKTKTYCFILTRQNVSVESKIDDELKYGAYQIYGNDKSDICIVANGSELELVLKNINEIEQKTNCSIKVISAPILKLFIEQDDKYIETLLKAKYGILGIEASNDANWYKLLKYTNKLELIQASSFGKSMDGEELYKQKGFNVENIINKINNLKE